MSRNTQMPITRLSKIISTLTVMAVVLVFTGSALAPTLLQGTASAAAKDSKHKSRVNRKKAKRSSTAGAAVQFIIKEKTVDKQGKTKYVARGNVPVTITTADKKARCRDAGKYYLRQGDIVFAGKSDGDRGHKQNLGKIKADKCTSGNYTVSIAPNPDVYTVEGASSQNITVAKKITKVKFTVVKKAAPAPVAEAVSQSTAPAVASAPVTPLSPITPAEEKIVLDKTDVFEKDMFFVASKSCLDEDDLGDTLANRKTKFVSNSSKYMTADLIARVNNQYSGDAFPLLGIGDLKCAQYQKIATEQTTPIVVATNGGTATVEHTFTATAKNPASPGYNQALDVQRTWTYYLVQDGGTWKISNILVR